MIARPYSSPRSKQSKYRREEIGRGSDTAARWRRSRENRRRPSGQTRSSGASTKAARPEAVSPERADSERMKPVRPSAERLRTGRRGAPPPRSAARRAGGRQAIGAPSGEPNPPGAYRSPARRAPRLLGAPEPERLRVAGSFGSRRARRSLGLFASRRPLRRLRLPGDEQRRQQDQAG